MLDSLSFVILKSIFSMGVTHAQNLNYDRQNFNALLFAEFDYREREGLGDDGLAVGQGVAQINYSVTDRLSFFTETTLTSRQDQSLNVEFERFIARYDFSDKYKLSAGRYHTPVGYWNEVFHHGSWLKTTVSRPQTLRFGSSHPNSLCRWPA